MVWLQHLLTADCCCCCRVPYFLLPLTGRGGGRALPGLSRARRRGGRCRLPRGGDRSCSVGRGGGLPWANRALALPRSFPARPARSLYALHDSWRHGLPAALIRCLSWANSPQAQAPQWQRAILAANNRSRASSDAAPASALLPSSCRLRVHAVAFSLDASSAPAAGGWEVYLPRSAVELEGDEAAEAAAPLALPQQLVDTSCESDDAGDEALLQSEARPLAELGNELLDVAAAAAAGGEVRRHSLASGDGNQAHASSVEDGGLHCAGAPAAAAAAAPLPSPLAGAARRFALAALAPDHGAKGGGALAAAAAVTGARALALSQSLPPPLPAAEDSCNNRSAVRTLRSLPSRLCGGAAGPAGEPGPAEGTEEHGGDRFHAAVQDALMGATGTTAAAAWRAVQARGSSPLYNLDACSSVLGIGKQPLHSRLHRRRWRMRWAVPKLLEPGLSALGGTSMLTRLPAHSGPPRRVHSMAGEHCAASPVLLPDACCAA